jgi:hypothetical protein
MDATMEEAAKSGHKGLLLLAELLKQDATIGRLKDLHSQRYLQKGGYRDVDQTGIDWVNQYFPNRARYFYKMFRMNPNVFMSLHDLLVLLCLRELEKDNIKLRDPTFSTDHVKVQEDRF